MAWSFHREHYEHFKCFRCLHVRTGTLLISIFHLIFHTLVIIFLIQAFNPHSWIENLFDGNSNITSSSNSPSTLPPSVILFQLLFGNKSLATSSSASSSVSFHSTSSLSSFSSLNHTNKQMNKYNLTYIEDNIMILILTHFGLLIISLMLFIGTLTGKAQYMTPFFCTQIFSLCLVAMVLLGYTSDVSNIKRFIHALPGGEIKEKLESFDNDQLTLLSVIASVFIMIIMVYPIGVVWGCYKYLKFNELQITGSSVGVALGGGGGRRRRGRSYFNDDYDYVAPDTEMLLPPKYEDVIRMSEQEAPPPEYQQN